MAPSRRQLLYAGLICGIVLFVYHRSNGGSDSASPSSSSDSFGSPPPPSAYRPSTATPLPTKGGSPTSLVVSMAGYSLFDNLYLRDGTVFLLSPPDASAYDPTNGGGGGFKDMLGVDLLPRKQITSTGVTSDASYEEREATEREIRVLPWEERALLNLEDTLPLTISGTTILLNDSGKLFLNHYYHLWMELLLGAWKSLVLGSDGSEDRHGRTNVAAPSRIMFPNADEHQWRDKAEINGYLLKTIWPSLAYEYSTDWDERIATGKTYVFERVVIVDRTAGTSGSKAVGPEKWFWKMMGNIFEGPTSVHWWQPIRRRLLDALPPAETATAPTITYISRQGHGRSLRDSDHVALVAALESLAARKGWNLEIPKMQTMTKDQQFALAARTTVMLGVHGNGLSHQLWMDPTPYSTVIEMFAQDGMVYDYALPAQALKHRHYTLWPTEAIDTEAKMRVPKYTDDFHGTDIRANAQLIVDLIEKRLDGWKP